VIAGVFIINDPAPGKIKRVLNLCTPKYFLIRKYFTESAHLQETSEKPELKTIKIVFVSPDGGEVDDVTSLNMSN
jgi:hypothetical protein